MVAQFLTMDETYMRAKSRPAQIEGVVGQLELRVFDASQMGADSEQQANSKNAKTWVVLSHPHPEFGGTMDNKVVTTMERFFQMQGYSTVAYNFRGVGESAGRYDGGAGEQQDLQAVVNWVKSQVTFASLILAGFSFGAYVTLSAQPVILADRLLIVAPPVGLYDFSSIHEVGVPWDMVVGLEDEVIDAKEMLSWALSLESKPSLYCQASASHFFHGQLIWLRNILNSLY